MEKSIVLFPTLLFLSYGQNILDPGHFCDVTSKQSCSYYKDIEKKNSDIAERVRSVEAGMRKLHDTWTGVLQAEVEPKSGDLAKGTEFVMEVIGYKNNPVIFLTLQSEKEGVLSMDFLSTDLAVNHTFVAGPNVVNVVSLFGISHRELLFKTLHCISSVKISLNYYGEQGDAYSVWPFHSLGKQYLVPAYAGKGTLEIVAIEDDTKITVTVIDNRQLFEHNIHLSYLQTKNYTGFDIAGSTVSSDKPIAVFTHQFALIPIGHGYADHMGEQCVDIRHLGTKYIIAPFRDREGYLYRVSATENLTLINIYGPAGLLEENVAVDIGIQKEITMSKSDVIIVISNKPIQLTFFSTDFNVRGGNPTMITLQALDTLVAGEANVSTPVDDTNHDNYMTVIARESYSKGLLMVNSELAVQMKGTEIKAVSVDGVMYTIYSMILSAQHYTLKHPEPSTEYSVIVYGFRLTRKVEAYGFYVIRG